MRQIQPTLIALSVSAMLGGATGVQAAGFALIEQSGSGMGNAFAGGAASAEDASTIFFNPAGMTRLPGRQVVVAAHGIKLTSDFRDGGSVPPAGKPFGGTGGDIGELALVPNLYASWALNDRLNLGLGVNAPFGLKTEYEANWVGRFQGVLSELKTINVNPAIAYKINDTVSVGAGLSYQMIDANLTRATNFGPFGEGTAQLKADDASWGWNLGALFNVGKDMRIGVAYRSHVRYRLEGDAVFVTPAAVPGVLRPANGQIFTEVELPETASLSVFQTFNEKWDIMGDITWTGWSRLQSLDIYRSNGALLQATPENWDDTLRYALGVSYRANERWKLRGGLAYDETPVPNQFRTVRIPDQSRTWVSFGVQWKISSAAALDFGYSHLFVKDASINDNQGTTAVGNGLVAGTYQASVDIVSAQLTYSF